MADDMLDVSFRAIHASTDHVFWGRRDAMRVAVFETWPAIYSYFNAVRPGALEREVYIGAFLASLYSVPSSVRKSSVSSGLKHYNKARET